jgi:hypothetical protein
MVASLLSGQHASLAGTARAASALARTTAFFLKVLPMLPSRPVDWLTRAPRVERVSYPVRRGAAETDLYRPATDGPHPGIVISLGVVPFGVDHPQVPRLGEALARAGFAALMHWSPAMRDRRLDPEDVEDIALAYRWLVDRPFVDPSRSGLLGTCVGGSFALMAAASPLVRDRVAFVAAFAPYSSMWTFARDIASASRSCAGTEDTEGAAGAAGAREPWAVDPLTRDVFVRSLTAALEPPEAERLRAAFPGQPAPEPAAPGTVPTATAAPIGPRGVDPGELSEHGRSVYALLRRPDAGAAEAALRCLPPALRRRLDALSPLAYLPDLRAPLIVLGHDRDDVVIPVGESRRLRAALPARAGVRYTEFGLFQHADPTKRKLPPHRLAHELGKFYGYVYPLFRLAATPNGCAGARAA